MAAVKILTPTPRGKKVSSAVTRKKKIRKNRSGRSAKTASREQKAKRKRKRGDTTKGKKVSFECVCQFHVLGPAGAHA